MIAAESCLVLADPLHMLYAKVNKFLNRGPTWNVEKLPSYWVEHVLMRLPTNDDEYYKEVSWLLDQLIDGLRTPEVSILQYSLPMKLRCCSRTWNSTAVATYWSGSFHWRRRRRCHPYCKTSSCSYFSGVSTLVVAPPWSLGTVFWDGLHAGEHLGT